MSRLEILIFRDEDSLCATLCDFISPVVDICDDYCHEPDATVPGGIVADCRLENTQMIDILALDAYYIPTRSSLPRATNVLMGERARDSLEFCPRNS